MAYLANSDITDQQARAFVNASDSRLTTWMGRVDDEINAIAESMSVDDDDITTPIHAKVKEYALAYFCFLVFQDVFATNNVESPEIEKYRLKLDWYADRCQRLRPTLTKEMFVYGQEGLNAVNRIGAGLLWRG